MQIGYPPFELEPVLPTIDEEMGIFSVARG